MAAAAARKLQKDIEVVLKKGHEGTEEFAELWEQMANASSGPQKERLGEELKKCINKLQRLRSQMRDWLGSNAVPSNLKDKLEDGRKLIENDMSRFKDFEREFKTKAFSGAGLAKMDELDLEEAEKLKYQDWLGHTIQALKDQLDQFEADTQLLSSKKNQSSDDKARLPKLQKAQETSRWHIKKLEQLLRAVNNDAVEISDLAMVKESIELLVENGEESELYHDELLYDSFDLTEYEEKAMPKGMEVDRPEESASSAGDSKKAKEKEKKGKKSSWDKKEKVSAEKKTPPPPKPPVISKVIEEEIKMSKMLDPEEVKVQEDQLLTEREEFICKICQIHVVGCRPKLTTCSHLFCGDCIAQWFNQHPDTQTWAQRAKAAGPDRCVPCPVCKKSLNENIDLAPLNVSVSSDTQRGENVLLWRMLSGLRIICANNPKIRKGDGKCDWQGEYGTYQKHIEVCKNVPLADADYPPEVVSKTPEKATPQLAAQVAPQAPPAKQVTAKHVPAPKQSPTQAPKMPVAPKAAAAAAAPSPAPAAPASAPVPVPAPVAPAAPAAPPSVPPQPRRYEERRESQPQIPQPAPQVAPAPAVAPVQAPRREEAAYAAPQAAYTGGYTGYAVGNFEATGPTMVPVRHGDVIEVLETHHTGWSYAKNLTNNSIPPGWVPSWIVDASRANPAPQPASPETPPVMPAQPAAVTPPRAEPVNKTVILQTRDREQDLRPAAAPTRAPPTLVTPSRDFVSGSDSQMSLSTLDQVEIVERHQSGWTFGRKMLNGASVSEGWFPDWACNPTA